MSGHSKWHNIKIKKSKVDQQRGKLFSKLAREIIIAAKEGGGDPAANIRLRAAIDRAREASMPNDNIQRAIIRGTGGGEGAAYEEVTYEGMGPGGVAVLVQVQTDNRNQFQVWVGKQQKYVSLDYPTANSYYDQGAIQLLRSAYEL